MLIKQVQAAEICGSGNPFTNQGRMTPLFTFRFMLTSEVTVVSATVAVVVVVVVTSGSWDVMVLVVSVVVVLKLLLEIRKARKEATLPCRNDG